MNGTKLPDDSRELLSIIEYMKWLATGIKVADWRTITQGTSNVKVSELSPSRPADPIRGEGVYENNCAGCHGYTGEGVLRPENYLAIWPIAWGHGYGRAIIWLLRSPRFKMYGLRKSLRSNPQFVLTQPLTNIHRLDF